MTDRNQLLLKMTVWGIIEIVLFVGLLFLPAGRWDYWQGWGLIGGYVGVFIIYIILCLGNPEMIDLTKERMKPGGKTRGWDKVGIVIFIPMYLITFVVCSLDAGRYGWTRPLPMVHYLFSWILFCVAMGIVFWAMVINKFFSSVVRIQTDRGHHVIQEGPYQYVRHPGYVGFNINMLATPLVLGSFWGLIPAGIIMIFIVLRTYLEDKTLQKELPGYLEYTQKVKYRLLPGVW